MNMPKEFEVLKDYLLEKPEPLRETLSVQIILGRNIMDYTVLRTEETRELNTAVTPLSMKKPDPTLRVVFLGGKQKAAETRALGSILRTATKTNKINTPICFLKDKLCMRCPRCALFGAVSTRKGAQELNFRHRIEYSSAFSLLPYEEIEESLAFNAIQESTTLVGQALGETPSVAPANLFPSIVTLNTVSWKEFLLTLKTLLATRSYGGETRTKGDVSNIILGIVGGWEEIISSLELTLELYDVYYSTTGKIDLNTIKAILDAYKTRASFIDKVKVLMPDEVLNVIKAVQQFDLSKEFLEESYKDVDEFIEKVKALEEIQAGDTEIKSKKGKK
ncbi:MAG: type I-D CRISPR-associated protein Cas7/Csc2 [Thermoproteota archaeon]